MGAKGPPFTGSTILRIAPPVKGDRLVPMERLSSCFDDGGGGSERRVEWKGGKYGGWHLHYHLFVGFHVLSVVTVTYLQI